MKRLLSLISVCLILSVLSCDKYESKIEGTITFIDAATQQEMPAIGAIVNKMKLKDGNLTKMAATETNQNGYYVFDFTSTGDWRIEASLMVDSILYTGSSKDISTNGLDNVSLNLSLNPTSQSL